ncbi:MAG: hypothetical protein A2039_10300 [Candidatus Melainabacteria bacterium GWA2_34_9]|nr:MAG: hypothetical protein A2039_10300 [Candidatus Melainabacteria bacterium GWA2_34_9]
MAVSSISFFSDYNFPQVTSLNSTNATQNGSIFGSNLQSINSQNFPGASLSQLEQQRETLIQQKQTAMENYPELGAQYDLKIKEVNDAINNKLSNGTSDADKNATIYNMDSQIAYSQAKLQQISQQRESIAKQAKDAAQYYPELAGQYQYLDKKLELEQQTFEIQLQDLQQQKTKISNSCTVNQNNNIMNILMMLLQLLFRGGSF